MIVCKNVSGRIVARVSATSLILSLLSVSPHIEDGAYRNFLKLHFRQEAYASTRRNEKLKLGNTILENRRYSYSQSKKIFFF
jgi:hypothetical protein